LLSGVPDDGVLPRDDDTSLECAVAEWIPMLTDYISIDSPRSGGGRINIGVSEVEQTAQSLS